MNATVDIDALDQRYWNPICTVNDADSSLLSFVAIFLMLIVPAMGLAQAGLVRRKSALSMIMQTLTGLVVASAMWYIVGFSLAFGQSNGGFIAGLEWSFLAHSDLPACYANAPNVPFNLYFLFQLAFAAFATVLPSGQWGDRVNYASFMAFIIFWPIVVYVFVAHWMWNMDGWLAARGATDFGGGIVVLTSAGTASFIASLMVRKRRRAESPGNHNLPLYIIGVLFLWVGWYVFQAGAAFASNMQASQALINTHLAATSGALSWLVASYANDRHWHLTEIPMGALSGVASVAASSGYIQSYSAFVIGILASLLAWVSSAMIRKQFKRYDVLDVTAVWGVPGAFGSLMLAFFADARISRDPAIEGMFRDLDVGSKLLVAQFMAVAMTILWSAVWTYIILFMVKYTTRLDLPRSAQIKGLDAVQIGKAAYDSQQKDIVRDMDYDTLAIRLNQAAAAGDAIKLDELIKEGAEVNAQDLNGRTPAHIAASAGRLNVLQLLHLKHGADLNVLDDANETPLSLAVAGDHLRTAQWLRSFNAVMPNEGTLVGQLLWAARTGNVAQVQRLLRVGVALNVGDYDGRTALMLAAAEGHAQITEMLIDAGADLGRYDRWGRTALDDARDFRHHSCAQVIRDALRFARHPRAVQILQIDAAKRRALAENPQAREACAAAAAGDTGALEALAEQGINLAATDYDGRSPLHVASAYGQTAAVELLLARGARVNALDASRATPLQLAINGGHAQAAAALQRAGGVVVNRHLGHTLCNIGAHGDVNALQRMALKGVDLNAANGDSRTAMHLAACHGHAQAVDFLLRAGAAVNVFDRFGHTPLDDAIHFQRHEVATLLRWAGGVSTLAGEEGYSYYYYEEEGYATEEYYYYLEEEDGADEESMSGEEETSYEAEYEEEYEVEAEEGYAYEAEVGAESSSEELQR